MERERLADFPIPFGGEYLSGLLQSAGDVLAQTWAQHLFVDGLAKGMANFFHKGPESKYFQLCGPHTAANLSLLLDSAVVV